MVLDYLRSDGNYFPKNVEEETKTLFLLEIQHWEVSEKLIEAKLPYFLVDMLKEEPKPETDSSQQLAAVNKWKELGTLSL